LCGLVSPYHLILLEPHPSVLRTATFPDREGYNMENTSHTENSEMRARQGKCGFVRRECTQKYMTEAKRKLDTVLRRIYEFY
jgi:hypothetical protein